MVFKSNIFPLDILIQFLARGHQVLYGEYDGTAVDYMGADHQFVRDQDILFVYSGEKMQPDTIKMIRDQLLVKVCGLCGFAVCR